MIETMTFDDYCRIVREAGDLLEQLERELAELRVKHYHAALAVSWLALAAGISAGEKESSGSLRHRSSTRTGGGNGGSLP